MKKYLGILFLVGTMIWLMIFYKSIAKIMLLVMLVIILLAIIISILIYKKGVIGKAIKYNNNADIVGLKKFYEGLNKQDLTNVKRATIELLIANLESYNDINNAENIFSKYEGDKNNKVFYNNLYFSHLLIKKDFYKCKKLLELKEFNNMRSLYNLYDKIYNTFETIEGIDNMYKHSKKKIVNISNLKMLMDYYCRRREFDKAKIYALELKKICGDFKMLNDEVNDILSR